MKYNKLTANILLTNVGLSLRKQTTVCRISSWDILIPFETSSCSERAKNKQLPSPWLQEITKPFSWASLFKFSDSLVWLVSLCASNWICWSVWSVWNVLKSPANSKSTKLFPVKKVWCLKKSRFKKTYQVVNPRQKQNENNSSEISFPIISGI